MSRLKVVQKALEKYIIKKYDGNPEVAGAVRNRKLDKAEYRAFLASINLQCIVDGSAAKAKPRLSCEANVHSWYSDYSAGNSYENELLKAAGHSWSSFFVAIHNIGKKFDNLKDAT
jgi:hypothetical protein